MSLPVRTNAKSRPSTSLGMNGVVISLLLTGCPGPEPTPPPGGHQASATLQTCATVREPSRVTTIDAAVLRLNQLPPPVSPACFVASLPRPLDVVATNSPFSAQPAASRESPRLFLFLPALIVSAVPEGEGAGLLEFSEWMTPTRTLKGELVMPITAPLSAEAPYTRVHSNRGTTTCGLCHRAEEPHPTIDGGFISDALRPTTQSLVPLAHLRAQHEACGEDVSERCEMFHALFDFGTVREGAFSNDVKLFGQ